MKLIRYLQEIKLLKSVNTKQSNGTYIKAYSVIDTYNVQVRTLNNEIDATIYGANITRMLRVSSPLKDLEKLLMTKVDNKEDNISLYFLEIEDKKYKITAVTKNDITVERL